ncbi:MAG: metal-dependent hydrolase [Salibacteraceae bacterium]
MKITYLGHSCFLISTGESVLLFDPFISGNELVQEALDAATDPKVKDSLQINNIRCNYVLLSHGHEDHVADAETILKNTGATLISNFEITNWFAAKGIERVHPMNHGGSWKFDFGTVHYVNAIHTSSMPDGTYGGNPGGFVVKTPETTLYYAGDTALTYDMKLIGEIHKPQVAFLPIGDNFTMGVDDAVRAASFVGCNKIIGMHYDTFGYIKLNHQKALDSFKQAGKELVLMKIGESIEL